MTIYAIPPEGCLSHLTAGNRYEVLQESVSSFFIHDDEGYYIHCLWKGCPHLNGGDWQRVEEPDDRQALHPNEGGE